MGAADIVPGVSGGTIAFITGIYEKLLESISNVNLSLLKTLRKKGVKAAWQKINGEFLTFLFIGIAISVFSLAKGISYLLDNHPVVVWSFFFGLILASIYYVGKDVKQKWTAVNIASFIAGAAIAWYVTTLHPASAPEATWFIFISGLIAICAMILPGISGSFILLLMGSYQTILDAIKTVDIKNIAVFALGCVIGILSISKLLNWMFKRYKNTTIMLLCGFLLGSLNKVWPWKSTVSTRIAHKGKPNEEVVPFIQENVLPAEYGELNAVEIQELGLQSKEPYLAFAIIAFIIGFALIFMIEAAAKTKKPLYD